MSEQAKPRNVGDKIASITGKVGPIVATGNNQFDQKKKALSVQDVEEALRPLLAEHEVVINWSVTSAALLEGQKLWRLDFHVTVFAAGDPDDKIEADWMDVGNSPSAAASYAVKGYYRRLFHLADAEEETQTTVGVEAKKPATLRRYANEIKKTWGPDQEAQGSSPEALLPAAAAVAPKTNGAEGSASPGDLQPLFELGRSLPKDPVTALEISAIVAAKGYGGARTRLLLDHARQCGKSPCDHVAQAAGLK